MSRYSNMTANVIRDKIKREEEKIAGYVSQRNKTATVKIMRDSSNDAVTEDDVNTEKPAEGRDFNFYHHKVIETQNNISELKAGLSQLNNTSIPSVAMGRSATIHELLVEMSFVSAEIKNMEQITIAGMKPDSTKTGSGYGSQGYTHTFYVYDEAMVSDYLEQLKDKQSALRREVDVRNNSLVLY